MKKFLLRSLDNFDNPSAPTHERVVGSCAWALIVSGNITWMIAAFILFNKLS